MKTYRRLANALTLLIPAIWAVEAQGSIVRSSLFPPYAELSIPKLFLKPVHSTVINAALASDSTLRPYGMAAPSRAIHLGTNTDIFSVGTPTNTSEYWIRYTLDPSSYRSETNRPWNADSQSFADSYSTTRTPITGELWFSYRNSVLSLKTSRLHDAWVGGAWNSISTTSFMNPTQTLADKFVFSQFACDHTGSGGDPYNGGLGCEWNSEVNLSFLQLKNGELYASNKGFDMVFFEHAKEGETVNHQLNIAYAAPVPLPATLLLLCSGLIGAAGFSQRLKRVGQF